MQPELVAQHYTQAGHNEAAIAYWQQAGQRALQRLANVEATAHVTRGLELLSALPETPERAQQELALLLILIPVFIATKYAHSLEVERVCTRVQALCQQVGETPQLFTALAGLHRFYFTQPVFQTAQELGVQFLRLAQHQSAPDLLLMGHWMLGTPAFWLGEVA